jgi:hypothetical protein
VRNPTELTAVSLTPGLRAAYSLPMSSRAFITGVGDLHSRGRGARRCGNARHQAVVIDPVEKSFEIKIDHDVVALGDCFSMLRL